MTNPLPTSDKWQKLFTAKAAHWDDSRRLGKILIPFLLIIIFTFFYLLIFIAGNVNKWVTAIGPLATVGTILVIVPVVMGALAFIFAMRNGAGFFTAFYRPPEDFKVADKMRLRMFGIPPLPMPLSKLFDYKYIVIMNPDSGIKPEHEWIKWLGGPVQFIIGDGCALYLERGAHFSRVVGPGLAFLERYETVKEVIDLRPQNMTDWVAGWTTDGILVKLQVRITFRIGVNFAPKKVEEKPKPLKEDALAAIIKKLIASISTTNKQPAEVANKSAPIYPFDPDAVKKVVEKKNVRMADGKPVENTWQGGVWGKVSGVIRDYILECRIDQLFIAGDISDSGQILSPQERQKMIDSLNGGQMGLEKDWGVHMTDLQILTHEIPDEIKQQRLSLWKAEKQGATALAEGEIKADQIRIRELGRAQSQRDMIMAIARGLENFPFEEEAILLSLSSVLDQSLGDPLKRSYIANEALDTLDKLQRYLRNRNNEGGEQ